jgi:hypothetical protein
MNDFFLYLWHVLTNSTSILAMLFLPGIVIAFLLQLVSNSIRRRLARLLGINGYIYLTAIGVMTHELGHALFCLIFRHRIVEMKLFSPESDGTLGYVNHSYNPDSRYQRIGNFFIGTGPIWLGVLVIYLLSIWLLPSAELTITEVKNVGFWNMCSEIISIAGSLLISLLNLSLWLRWQTWLWLYLILTIGSHITLSPPDVAGAADGFVVITTSIIIINLLTMWIYDFAGITSKLSADFFGIVYGILLYALVLLLIIAIILKICLRK